MSQTTQNRAATPIELARDLISRHGLQAAAVAHEHANQSKASGDRDAMHRWSAVHRFVNQLRAESRSSSAPLISGRGTSGAGRIPSR